MEYTIGDFSTISRLGIKTLRYYHEIGLLAPSRVDPFTGYRYYDEGCLTRVRAIQRLKELKFSLNEIHDILTHQAANETLLQTIQVKLAEMDQKIAEFRQVRDRLAAFVTSESVPLIFPDKVIEKDVPGLQIASIRFHGHYPDLSEKIPCLLADAGDAIAGPPFSLYYDDHPLEEGNDIEICAAVSRAVESGVVHTRLLAGGHAVSILHHGNYDQIWVSYQTMVDYLNQRQLHPIYPSREIYLKGGGPDRPAEAQDYLTEIQFLVN